MLEGNMNMDISMDSYVKKHDLRRKEIFIESEIERGFDNMDKTVEHIMRESGKRVTRYIAACAVKDIKQINIKYPKDWKEAVKERFAPKWYLRKHPVKYYTERHKILAYYPDVAIHDKPHIVIHTVDGMPPLY